MSVKRRRSENVDVAAVEEWGSQAGQPHQSSAFSSSSTAHHELKPTVRPDLPAHRLRAKSGPKKDAVSFRFNAAQRELLNIAVAHEDMSQQELLETLIWEVLEERYGALVPLHE